MSFPDINLAEVLIMYKGGEGLQSIYELIILQRKYLDQLVETTEVHVLVGQNQLKKEIKM